MDAMQSEDLKSSGEHLEKAPVVPTLALSSEDKALEKRLIWKLDLLLVPICFLLYIFCFIDRTNIGNARIAGLEKDLKLQGTQYNVALTIFYIFYILVEIPSQIAFKIVGARIWITALVFGFGLVTMCTAFITNYSGLVGIRILLGITEGGVMPALSYLLTRYYTRAELMLRVAIFVQAATLAGAIGGLLASGFLAIGEVTSQIYGWRNIFFFEGIMSMAVAVVGWFIIADEPSKNRWLTPEEAALAERRVQIEHLGSSQALIEAFSWKHVTSGLGNIFVVTMGVIFSLINISVQGLSLFTPTVVRTLYPGLPVVQQQLRTSPPYFVGFFFGIAESWLITRYDRRSIIMLPCLSLAIIGFAIFSATEPTATGPRFASLFLGISGAFPIGPLVLAWSGNNTHPDMARGIAMASCVCIGTLGAVVATWSFLPSFAPTYHNAAYINIGSTTGAFVLIGFAWWYCKRENRLRDEGKRDHRLVGLNHEQAMALGHRHPQYRYRY